MFKPSEEKKDYRCPRCAAQWTQLEVLDSVGPMGFLCHRCGGPLVREDPTAGDNTGSEKQVKLAAQFARVLKLLEEIDNATIPKNDFETALSLQLPIQRNNVNPVRDTVPLEGNRGPPAAVKGLNQPIAQDLTVDLTSSAEKTAAEKAAEEDRKAAIAAQNVLPVWHTQSTVTSGADPSIKNDPVLGSGGLSADIKDEKPGEDGKVSITTAVVDESDQLAAYYAGMAQEKEKEEREDREAEESSEDDEDDEDDFEDIDINATPTSSQSNLKAEETVALKPPPNAMTQGNDLASESGSSAPGSVASTPGGAMDTDGPVVKRVKVEEANGGAVGSPAVPDEDDEEADFEDAL